MDRIALPERPRILVIALRRLGDVLLATPLIRSLRRAWPQARIEALVFAGTQSILDGNPDLDGVVVMPARPTHLQSAALGARLWRRYDLAISTTAGDRPTGFAWAAGKRSVGPVTDDAGGRFKRFLLSRSIPVAEGMHRVTDVLRLADAIGIAPVGQVVSGIGASSPVEGRYAVIHAAPMFRYKQWTREGWRAIATTLRERGLQVVATGGPADHEKMYLDGIWSGMPDVRRLDGHLTFPQLAALLANAAVYVGPDTSVTHLAAASGCPIVAIYGPTDARIWGPWPASGLDTPWAASARTQQRGNVWLVQNPLPCMPCQKEGCLRRRESYSACLDELTVADIMPALEQALTSQPAARLSA
jgi:heptosyltransferase-3